MDLAVTFCICELFVGLFNLGNQKWISLMSGNYVMHKKHICNICWLVDSDVTMQLDLKLEEIKCRKDICGIVGQKWDIIGKEIQGNIIG